MSDNTHPPIIRETRWMKSTAYLWCPYCGYRTDCKDTLDEMFLTTINFQHLEEIERCPGCNRIMKFNDPTVARGEGYIFEWNETIGDYRNMYNYTPEQAQNYRHKKLLERQGVKPENMMVRLNKTIDKIAERNEGGK